MKKCINCHADLPGAAGNKKYCRECAAAMNRKNSHDAYARRKAILEYSKKAEHKSTMDNLIKAANEASRCGMSYGKYHAKGGS